MEAITIHPKTTEQVQVFEQMAKALNLAYEVAATNEETQQESAFMKEFNEAKKNGFTIEESRERTLKFVDELWKK